MTILNGTARFTSLDGQSISARVGDRTGKEFTPKSQEWQALLDGEHGPVEPYAPPPPPTVEELEADVQKIADDLIQTDERMMAMALATVDLRLADITGLTLAQTRTAFRDRVVFYLRQRRGI